MNALTGEILTLPKMSGSVSTPKSLSGNVGAKTINIGGKGDDGATFTPSVSANGIISWTNDKDLPNPEPVNIKGAPGKDGQPGKDGIPGQPGKDGYTPIKGVDYFDGKDGVDGYTPVKGKDYFDGSDGKDGVDGKDGYTPIKGVDYFDGADGKIGADGKDGYSPSVEVSDIDGGHRVTITDKDGAKAFDVMDGAGGSGGTVHWNDVQDKPVVMVGGSDTLTWDGNTEGLVEVIGLVDPGMKWYKVSDKVFTDEEIRTMSFTFAGTTERISDVFGDEFLEDCVSSIVAPFLVFVRKPNAVAFSDTELEQTFPEVGVYFFRADEIQLVTALQFPNYTGFNAQEKIAPSHLYQPDWEQMDESQPDFIKNKPFGEMPTGGDTLYWDGNTEGLLEVVSDVGTFYKVSDVVVDEADMNADFMHKTACIVTTSDGDIELSGDELTPAFEELTIGAFALFVFCIAADNTEAPALGLTFPEKGVYFNATSGVRAFKLLNYTKFHSTKLMDKKYLPMDDITAAVLSALPIYNGEVAEV